MAGARHCRAAGGQRHAGRSQQARRPVGRRFLRHVAVRQPQAVGADRTPADRRLRRRFRPRRPPQTPVAFARAIGRTDEAVTLTTLAQADPAIADMSTLILVGASTTRLVARPGQRPFVLTPRSYEAPR